MRIISQVDRPVNTFDVLNSGVEQLKEEHGTLKIKLSEIYASAKAIGEHCTGPEQDGFLQRLRESVISFMQELVCHTGWEDEVLLPAVADFTGTKKAAVMGYDYVVGIQNMKRFVDMTEGVQAHHPVEEVERAAACLVKAYHALGDQLKIEEDILFPLADEMLTDMEQFFS